ncbi:hypothetical protein BH09MYX1_BH09MYX1_30770 [soil metagenome]
MKHVLGMMALLAVSGCGATSFDGNAYVPGGANGCYKKCEAAGMSMASFVYVGEFSTACVCALKPSPATPYPAYPPAYPQPSATVPQPAASSAGGETGALVGVSLAMRARADAQRSVAATTPRP